MVYLAFVTVLLLAALAVCIPVLIKIARQGRERRQQWKAGELQPDTGDANSESADAGSTVDVHASDTEDAAHTEQASGDDIRRCSNCGAENGREYRYCQSCAQRL
jgi:hypothetical protein